MPYIGNPIYQSAFVTDQFNGDGSTTTFTMSVSPAGVTNVLVAVSGVLQDPSTYGVVGNTITFSAAPPSGTGNISCRYLGVPASGITTTAYRTVTEFTATASQTTFTPPSYNVGFINVYLNGVLLGSADYTATNGTTVVLAVGASAGNLVTVESFLISSVANAIPNAAGSVGTTNIADNSITTAKIAPGAVIPADLSTGGPYWDTSSNVGIGTTSPAFKLDVRGANQALINSSNPTAWVSVDSGLTTQSMYMQANTSSSDCRVGSYTNHPLGLYTNNTERLRINTSGQVTIPAQPSFYAMANGSTAYAANSTIVFQNVQFNIGSYYNNSNGQFTAPVAGRYLFYAQMLGDASGNRTIAYIAVNNTTGAVGQNMEISAVTSQYNSAQGTVILNLAAGDYVSIKTTNVNAWYGGSSFQNIFCGHLLS